MKDLFQDITFFPVLTLTAPAPQGHQHCRPFTTFRDLITAFDVKLEIRDAFPAEVSGALQKQGSTNCSSYPHLLLKTGQHDGMAASLRHLQLLEAA